MAKINLLPWRESLRQTQKKQYIASLGAIAVGIFILFWIVGEVIEQQIRNQQSRNLYLTQQVEVLDRQIAEITDIRAKKKEISMRMALIEQLQVSRNLTPMLLEELAKAVPDGISFNSMSRRGYAIKIIGVSESNNRLSAFMRALDDSDLFVQPELSSIVADQSAANAVSDFELSLKISPVFTPAALPEQSNAGQ
ncbi:PilN domain-containing protein [Glaciecola sp. 1036]|uniref:PilN domain-containing protein n=1 Tax=Alteromonadaceae TaxID=72275 RepID=UPI003D0241C4